ncbi:DUF6625 family protein [Vibrio fluvialis]|uniref:DUF6625 family protein n=1 Tax=Vibrio fluvialis TaxID=676 RepID=UPI001F222B65|nr:DUF6625 family protein [Vibrio fluvialis]MCE7592520.1 hypothetical protein [Vibrio fluvialis]
MNKILIIVPYYGELPKYFKHWLKTCEENQQLDWLIVSDDKNEYIKDSLPKNVRYLNLNIEVLQERVNKIIGFDFRYFTPYRLCDCRPFFGMMFKEQTSKYEFWGWSDIDLLYGDLSTFINQARLNEFDKIYNKGHLSIVKNSQLVNSMILELISDNQVKQIFLSKYSEGFDERYFNDAFLKKGLKIMDEKECIDISPRFYEFRNLNDNNKMVAVNYNNGKIIDSEGKEYPYIHFQKRNFRYNSTECSSYFISPIGFTNYIFKDNAFSLTKKNIAFYLRFIKKYLIPQHINRIKSKIGQ